MRVTNWKQTRGLNGRCDMFGVPELTIEKVAHASPSFVRIVMRRNATSAPMLTMTMTIEEAFTLSHCLKQAAATLEDCSIVISEGGACQ
jgi:hypothetical protein